MHSDLDGLKRTQENIRDKLSGSRRGQKNQSLVRVGEKPISIPVLGNFIDAVFASSLETVANKSGRPSEKYTTKPFFCIDGPPS